MVYNADFPKNGQYQLRVISTDRSKNKSGANDYRVNFKVENEASISAMLPYPNPFTTNCKFVFTLTGREVPDKIKIQIFNISGRVVKEIREYDLGALRIGNNISNYSWDGTDTYGDRLANGVYLYKVQAQLHGQNLKIRTSPADGYMHNGIGKIYLMR